MNCHHAISVTRPCGDCQAEEYERVAEWCAINGYDVKKGAPLPEGISRACKFDIDCDREAFVTKVKGYVYAKIMEELNKVWPSDDQEVE